MFFIKAVVLALMLTTVASSYDDLEELLRAQRERVKSIIAEAHAKTAKDSQPLKDAGIQAEEPSDDVVFLLENRSNITLQVVSFSNEVMGELPPLAIKSFQVPEARVVNIVVLDEPKRIGSVIGYGEVKIGDFTDCCDVIFFNALTDISTEAKAEPQEDYILVIVTFRDA